MTLQTESQRAKQSASLFTVGSARSNVAALLACTVAVGWASPPAPTCEEQIARAVMAQTQREADGSTSIQMPRIPDADVPTVLEGGRWLLLNARRQALVLSPPAQWYAVLVPGRGAAGGQADGASCDLDRAYLVVHDGGIGNPRKVYGALDGRTAR